LINLEILCLSENQIPDLSPLTSLNKLDWLDLRNNPLNKEAYEIQLPQIRKNNPSIKILLSFHPRQLVAPVIINVLLLVVILYSLFRHWTKGWILEILFGLSAAGIGVYFGMGAQILYTTGTEITFFGNGVENPQWLGGVFGGIFGFLTGIWFAQYLRKQMKQDTEAARIFGKGTMFGTVLGVLCSTIAHILLMIAYRNLNFWPMLIGAGFGTVSGLVVGAVLTTVFLISKKPGQNKPSESVTQTAEV